MQKKIIIIGASSGIGREMALLYASAGHKIGITGRRTELMQEIKNQYPDNITTGFMDVMEPASREQLKHLVDSLGGMDLFIYNAGFGALSETLDYKIEVQTIKTNVEGFISLVQFAFDYFVKQGLGHIALTSSIAALRGNSWAPAYSASKAFMSNYAEGLQIKANKLHKPIAVTDIKPGFIRTKMAQGNGQFWVADPGRAALQIVKAIDKKKRIAYITRRWWLIAQLMKTLPYSLYRHLG